MKFIITKREYNSSVKLIKKLAEQLMPLVTGTGASQEKMRSKLQQIATKELLWDDIVVLINEPIIVDSDGTAIYIQDKCLVLDMPEVLALKGIVLIDEMSSFMAAVAKPMVALLGVFDSMKDVIKRAGEHFKRTVKAIDNYSVMEKHHMLALLKERDASIDADDLTEQEVANMLRALDKIDDARVKAADKKAAAAAAEVAAFEHDAAKPDVIQDL